MLANKTKHFTFNIIQTLSVLASCTAQINAQLRLFSPNHSDISPYLSPLSLVSLYLLSLLSGAQAKDAGLLGGVDDMDRGWFQLRTIET